MTQGNELQISELKQITGWLETAGIGFIEIGGKGTVVRLTLEGQTLGGKSAVNPQAALPLDVFIIGAKEYGTSDALA